MQHKTHAAPEDQSITPSRDECVYTSCYCEENVWKLCEHVQSHRQTALEEVFAVFISNERRMIPLWRQRSGHGNRPVVWDYHVILLHQRQQGASLVYDLDSVLPFPCPLPLYEAQAFQSDHSLKPAYWRKLRAVPADAYLRNFASDRSHMRDADGTWREAPPPYPCIETTDSKMNLDDYISMDPGVGCGRVFSLSEFVQHFT